MLTEQRNSKLLKSGQIFLFLAILLTLLGTAPGRVKANPPDILPPPQLTAPLDRVYISALTPVLEWTTVPGAASYWLFVNPINNSSVPSIMRNLSSASYHVQLNDGLVYGTTYLWFVMAVSKGFLAPSAPSNVRRFTPTIQQTPADGAYSTSSTVTFKWASVAGAVNYDFYKSASLPIDYSLSSGSPTYSGMQTSQTVSNLAYGPQYWGVCVTRSTGERDCPAYPDGVNPWVVTVTTNLPAAPGLSSPKANSITNINTPTFSWGALPAGSAGTPDAQYQYQIQIALQGNFAQPALDTTVDTASYTLTNVQKLADGQYSWRVRAINGVGAAGKWSASWTISIDTTPPPMPVLISPADYAALTTTQPTFKWSKCAGATSYELIIQDNTGPVYNFDKTGLKTTSYSLSAAEAPTLDPQINYYFHWQVKAFDAAGNWSENESSFMINPSADEIPGAPALNEPSPNRMTNAADPTFSWTLPSLNPSIYTQSSQIQVSSSPTFSTHFDKDVDAGTTSIDLASIAAFGDGTYYWRVAAYYLFDPGLATQEIVLGPWSEVRKFSIKTAVLQAPGILTPGVGAYISQNRPTLSWTAVAGASYYTLAIFDTWGELPSITVKGTSYRPSVPFKFGLINWNVTANDGYGNSSSNGSIFNVTLQISPQPGFSTSDPARLSFKWNKYPGATYHELIVSNGNSNVIDETLPESVTSYTPSSSELKLLAPGSYRWTVMPPVDVPFPPVPIYTPFSITSALPAAPVLLKPANNAIFGAIMSYLAIAEWDNVAYASAYEAQISTTNNFLNSPTVTADLAGISYEAGATTMMGLSPIPIAPAAGAHMTYYWRVRGVTADGAHGAWSAVRSYTWYPGSPAIPTPLSPANGGSVTNSQLWLSWSPAAGAAGYDVEFASGALANDVAPTRLGNVTRVRLPASTGEGVYYWEVRSYDAAGNPSDWSPPQNFYVLAGQSVLNTPTPTPTAEPSATLNSPTDVPATLQPAVTPTALPSDSATVQPSPTPQPSDTALPAATTVVPSPTAAPSDTAIPEPTSTPEP